MLSIDLPLTRGLLKEIADRGHSRVPLYYGDRKDLVVSILRVKDLITYNAAERDEDNLAIRQLMKDGTISLIHPLLVAPDETADKILFLQTNGRSHLAIVVEDAEKLMTEGADVAKYIFTDDEEERARLKNELDNRPADARHKLVGIQTLENLLEKILGFDIVDEDSPRALKSFVNFSGTVTDI
jgi:metal transporter CNNM